MESFFFAAVYTMLEALSIVILLVILVIVAYTVWVHPHKGALPHHPPPHKPPPHHHPPHKQLPEVYVYDVGRYGIPFYAAVALAKSMGAELATYDQLVDAYKAGAEWCHYAWVNTGTPDAPKLESMFPMQTTKHGCGRRGLNKHSKRPASSGLTVFGIKPKQGTFETTCAPHGKSCVLSWNANYWYDPRN